jgi:hypothetical protein
MRNPVAKFAGRFNKAVTHTDRKKSVKSGYRKYRDRYQGLKLEHNAAPALNGDLAPEGESTKRDRPENMDVRV